jgi:hypothetical protein
LETIDESEELSDTDPPVADDAIPLVETTTDDQEDETQVDAASERLLNEQIFPETVELEDCVEGSVGTVQPLDDCFDS